MKETGSPERRTAPPAASSPMRSAMRASSSAQSGRFPTAESLHAGRDEAGQPGLNDAENKVTVPSWYSQHCRLPFAAAPCRFDCASLDPGCLFQAFGRQRFIRVARAFEPPPRSAVRPIGPRSGHQRMPQESVMKCANPTCNHSVGLVSHRRGLFGKRPYCSRQCRDHFSSRRRRSANAPPLISNGCSCSQQLSSRERRSLRFK